MLHAIASVPVRSPVRPSRIGHQVRVSIPAHHVDEVVLLHGNRNRVHADPGRFPDLCAALEIVGADLRRRGHDDLLLPSVLGDERLAPGGAVLPRRLPDLAPGRGVEHRDEPRPFVIDADDEAIAVEHGRRSFAELQPDLHLDAEVLLPERPAVDVVGVQTPRAEERIHAFPVGRRGVGGETAVQPVVAFVRCGGRRGLLPEDLARRTVEREDIEPVLDAGSRAAARSPSAPFGRSRRLSRLRSRDRRRQEDAIACDDGARVPPALDFYFP